MMLASTSDGLREAQPGTSGSCPSCQALVLPKCGPIVTWHWAHRRNDCDPWSEPESAWHQQWKRQGAQCEVLMRQGQERHRADIVTPTGLVVELQAHYLSAVDIAAREAFYGRMIWLYRATWLEALHFGRYGFWWKHGAKSMTHHRRPVYWDTGDGIWNVRVTAVDSECGTRVLGKVFTRVPTDRFACRLGSR